MTFSPILAEFDLSGLPQILDATNKRTAQNEQRSYRRTVENWNEKPDFYIEVSNVYYGNVKDYKVFTDSLIYLWVDEGTDKHQIKPNGPYALRIRGYGGVVDGSYNKSYYPKSTPDKIVSSGSGVYSSIDAWGESVTQNIEARNFTVNILKKARDRWIKALDTEIKKYIEGNVK